MEDIPDEDDFCRQCGERLPIDNFAWKRRFCSNRCRNRWHYEACPEAFRVPRHGERTCQTCGGTFLAYTPRQKYCSHPCYGNAKKGTEPPHLRQARALRCEAAD